MSDRRPIYIVHLRPEPRIDGERALRATSENAGAEPRAGMHFGFHQGNPR